MSSSIIILDTNLLVLLTVGTTNIDYIAKHKKLSAYNKTDFQILTNILAKSQGIKLIPNVLSETSNLLRSIEDPIKSEISEKFKTIIKNASEDYIESKIAVEQVSFIRLGLTDSALMELVKSGATLLTADLDLYLAVVSSGFDAINYNHIKDDIYSSM